MIYSNDDPLAVLVMEADRTGRYGEDYYSEREVQRCPVCGAYEPDHYYLNDDEDCMGCSECLYRCDVLF